MGKIWPKIGFGKDVFIIREGFLFMIRRIVPIWAYIVLGLIVTLLLFLVLFLPTFFIMKEQLTANSETITNYLQSFVGWISAKGLDSLPEFPSLEAGWVYLFFSILVWLSALFFENWVLTFMSEMVIVEKSVFTGLLRRFGINFLKRIGIGFIEGIVSTLFAILFFAIISLGLSFGLVSQTGASLMVTGLFVFSYLFLLFQIHVKVVLYTEKKGILTTYKGAMRIYKEKLDTVGKNLLQTVAGSFIFLGFIGFLIFVAGLLFPNQVTYADLILLLLSFPLLLFLSQFYFFQGYKKEIRPVLFESGDAVIPMGSPAKRMDQPGASYVQRIKPVQTDRNGTPGFGGTGGAIPVAQPVPDQGTVGPVSQPSTQQRGENQVALPQAQHSSEGPVQSPVIPAGKVVCPSCGAMVKPGKFCGQCGSPLRTDLPQ